MKSRMFSIVCAVLVVALFKSLPCMAQAEIDPDHFDTHSLGQIAGAQTIATSLATGTGAFWGTFTLPHEVSYAGTTLPAGAYSLSIRSHEGWNLVTLTCKKNGAGMQARVKSLPGSDRPAALILERAAGQSVLTGISLDKDKPGTMLDLPGAYSRPISPESEIVPISYVTRTRATK